MARRQRRRSSGTNSIFGPDKRGYFTAQIHVGYYANGRRKFSRKRSRRESDVVTWMDEQTVKRSQGIAISPERVTVEQFLNAWLERVERANRYSTHRGYSQICRAHVIPRIGKLLMSKLALPQVQAILDELHDAGLARNTIRNVKAALMTATADVEKVYPSAYDAIRRAKVPQARKQGKKTEPSPAAVIRALTPEQAQLLLVLVEHERLKALYWTTLLLGLRRGEVLGLLIEDLDLEGQRIRISGSLQRQTGKGMVRLDYAKTEASETWLPLPDVLVPVLRAHLAMLEEERTYKGWKEKGLLFPSSVGTGIGDRNLIRHFKAMLERGKLPDIRFHDLRHSCATLLITLGVHPRIIMEILRHTQISTTMNLYGHAIPEVNRQAVNDLGELVQPATLELPERVKK